MERGEGDCKRIAATERNDRSAPRNHRPSILAAVDTPSVSDGSLVFPSMKVAENLKRAITPNDYSFRLDAGIPRARLITRSPMNHPGFAINVDHRISPRSHVCSRATLWNANSFENRE